MLLAKSRELGRPEDGTPPARPATAPLPVDSRLPDDRRRILVAEDTPINQRVLLAMLEKLGYGAYVVGDGRAAVAAVSAGRYDAILMDCRMPGMDGFEATAEIRRQETGGTHVPIIALTASAVGHVREQCLGPAWTIT